MGRCHAVRRRAHPHRVGGCDRRLGHRRHTCDRRCPGDGAGFDQRTREARSPRPRRSTTEDVTDGGSEHRCHRGGWFSAACPGRRRRGWRRVQRRRRTDDERWARTASTTCDTGRGTGREHRCPPGRSVDVGPPERVAHQRQRFLSCLDDGHRRRTERGTGRAHGDRVHPQRRARSGARRVGHRLANRRGPRDARPRSTTSPRADTRSNTRRPSSSTAPRCPPPAPRA